MSFAIFNERFYLDNNLDVKAAVTSGAISSGLEHFQRFGFQEGRTLVSSLWNEQLYLQQNPDVAAAVAARSIPSGLAHFISFGEAERRPGAPVIVRNAGFNEAYYFALYPDVSAAFAAGRISSGQSHFIRSGQLENRIGVFTGTRGDDIITGTGEFSGLVGVEVDIIANRQAPDIRPTSLGVGEIDLLSGGGGRDTFLLGVGRTGANPVAQGFYVGQGEADFAYIKSFEINKDSIQLAGRPGDYGLSTNPINVGGTTRQSVSIFTNAGDRVAVVEGVTSLRLIQEDTNQNIFFLG